MSDPNIPPLPPLLCLHLASNTPGHTEEQMRAYGLLCLRQGWKRAAGECAEQVSIVGMSDNPSRVLDRAIAVCRRIASDSPK